MALTNYLVPALLLLAAASALRKRADVYGTLIEGGREGLKLTAAILPSLVMLLTALALLRESGALDALTRLLAPAAKAVGIPPETVPLLLVRPFSGSAALAVGAELMAVHGPESMIGRTAAVMLGSTETTFYTVSVYFSAAGIRKSRFAVPAALTADAAGFLAATFFARLLP
jgi:spore maturation protein B